jgi:hypothetical protein
MRSTASPLQATGWLIESSPKQLESLVRDTLFGPSAPIPTADSTLNAAPGYGVPKAVLLGI